MVLPQYYQMQGIITQNNRYKLIIDKLAYNPISTLISGVATISHVRLYVCLLTLITNTLLWLYPQVQWWPPRYIYTSVDGLCTAAG